MDTVREGRKPGWFWADNKILDVYAKEIGPHATLVYMVLVRHLNAEGQCWPSFQYIADMVGLSRRAVMRAIDALEEANLITVEKRFTDKKVQTTNCYTILDMADIASHEPRSASPTATVTDSHPPSATQSPPPVTDSHSNKTYMNNTQLTSGGVARSTENAAAVDQSLVDRLMDEQMLMPDQARRAAALDCVTAEVVDRLTIWRQQMIERNMRLPQHKQKKPQAILWFYLKQGFLPDDLPPPPEQEPTEFITWDDETGVVIVPESVRLRLEADKKKQHIYHR
jgi:DNA-binding transcriptional ArsR family regulator